MKSEHSTDIKKGSTSFHDCTLASLQALASPRLRSHHINNYTPLWREPHQILCMIMVAVKSLKKTFDKERL